jgi:uncharacterized protein (TIGR03437 family)
LLKIAIASGEIDELIPRTPYVDANQTTAPGKLTTLTGEGLSDSALSSAAPLPYTLDDVAVTIQGEPTLILSVQPTSLTVLTPPDVVPTIFPATDSFQLDVASASPFTGGAVPVQILSYAGEFLLQSGRDILAAHEDWSALVTADNPAHPGELVHAYAVGLGATSPAVPYGAPAPAEEPLARLTTSYQCSSPSNGTKELEILFQGLAPNLAGIYQIDWLVPPDAVGDFAIECQATIGTFMLIFSGLIPVGP